MRFGLCDEGERLRFASSPSSRGHTQGWQHRLCSFVHPPVVFHSATIGQEKVDALGAVHSAAATKSDDRVDAMLHRKLLAGFYMFGRWVLLDAIKYVGFDGLAPECLQCVVDVASSTNTGVGHYHRPMSSEFSN